MRGFEGRAVCVTGGAGFIGSHLVDSLVERGAAVRVLDDFSTGSARNLSHLAGKARVIRGSVLDPGPTGEAVAGADTVFHLAAYVSAAGSVREPAACHEVNSTGTLRLLEACRAAGVRRVVFASSAAVYGERPSVPTAETEPILPCSVYAQSKAAGEQLLRVWSHLHGVGAVSLRFFNVFGPRQSRSSAYAAAIASFADALLSGRRIMIFGDGAQTRDFVPVRDVVDCLRHAAVWEGPARGEAFNVGLGRASSIREVASVMARLAGAEDNPEFGPPRPGDVLHSRACVEAARSILGFRPSESLQAGLASTIAWYREHREAGHAQ